MWATGAQLTCWDALDFVLDMTDLHAATAPVPDPQFEDYWAWPLRLGRRTTGLYPRRGICFFGAVVASSS
jgi:hypothetical protein